MRMIPMTLDDIVRITFSVFRYLTIAPRPHSLSRLTNSFLHWRLLRSTLFYSLFLLQRSAGVLLSSLVLAEVTWVFSHGRWIIRLCTSRIPEAATIYHQTIYSLYIGFLCLCYAEVYFFYKVLFLLDGWENEMTHPAQKKLWTGRLWSIRTLMSLMERRIMILELASLSFWLFIYWSVDVLESFSDVHLAFLIYSSLVRWLMCTLSISLMDTCVLVPVALMPIPPLHYVFWWASCACSAE